MSPSPRMAGPRPRTASRPWWGLVALVITLLWSGWAQAREVPALTGRVVDEAGVLSAGEVRQLEQQLAAYEQHTGRQFAVLTVGSLQGDPLEDFSIRVVDQWQLGREGQDDGLLVVLAMAEQRVRIEVGYGLEGDVTDLESSRIIHEDMRPHLRRGRPGQALRAGVESLMQHANAGGVVAAEPEAPSFWTRQYWGHPGFWYVLVGGAFVVALVMCLRWPLVGIVGVLLFGKLWWPGALACLLALYARFRWRRRRSRRDGYGIELEQIVRSRSRGGLRSFGWKLGGLLTVFGIGKLFTSRAGRSAARRIGGGGLLGGGSGIFSGKGGKFGGGGASGGW